MYWIYMKITEFENTIRDSANELFRTNALTRNDAMYLFIQLSNLKRS